ncbi:hypothetical protein [Streptomyces radicis]|uniref:Poxvirus protein I5 n=1 Tax=Streptomyces radicis TaxID=1750517 RepID=A0A3A9VYR6_9ACTN|nr:hypothetical protein [Streptomyces radicis]RKN06071.1 hypothetical protein D7319_22925 [Streptomyces radicis]RKN18440.1 hypothetical protein D7318_21785 [Streptomyces radicis]
MRESRWSTGFALFGEVVITGALVALLSVPLVTALPALAAGTAHLRRHLDGESVRVAEVLRDFAAACRTLWPAALAVSAAALLLLWNLSLAQAGVVPGAAGLLVVTALLIAALAVGTLRTADAWRPGGTAGEAVREAAERASADVPGSVLLAFACAMCGVFVWMLLPLVLVCGGLLSLATVAVTARAAPDAAAERPE